ncbi:MULTISPECIES: hypothetical protein, partial [unclassified Methanoculleus]|uniref:hypothetical protein n=1 Tax=unclassified Methanoculleus TaxID=2619537 RepID=UPI00319DF06F
HVRDREDRPRAGTRSLLLGLLEIQSVDVGNGILMLPGMPFERDIILPVGLRKSRGSEQPVDKPVRVSDPGGTGDNTGPEYSGGEDSKQSKG